MDYKKLAEGIEAFGDNLASRAVSPFNEGHRFGTRLHTWAKGGSSSHAKTGMSYAEAIKRGMAKPKRKNNDFTYQNSDHPKQ
jgi:hypothetical protein